MPSASNPCSDRHLDDAAESLRASRQATLSARSCARGSRPDRARGWRRIWSRRARPPRKSYGTLSASKRSRDGTETIEHTTSFRISRKGVGEALIRRAPVRRRRRRRRRIDGRCAWTSGARQDPEFANGWSASSEQSNLEFNPDRRVIAGLLPASRRAVDPGGFESLRESWAQQRMVDPNSGIALERIPPIVPEGVDPLVGKRWRIVSVQPCATSSRYFSRASGAKSASFAHVRACRHPRR